MSSVNRRACTLAIVSMMAAPACSGVQQKRDDASVPAPTVAVATVSLPGSADQLASRLLAWLPHIETPNDLSASAVQQNMGLRMQPAANDAEQFEATGSLAGAWRYSLATVRSSYGVAPHALRLRFDDGRDGTSDMSQVCRFDAMQYQSSLERAGFEPRVIANNTRQIDFNRESGSGLHVTLYVRSMNPGSPQRKCVDMVLIDFMPGPPRAPHNP